MNKSKYKNGEQITSIEELMKQRMICFDTGNFRKIYNNGWFRGWSLNLANMYVENGWLYHAELIREEVSTNT